MQQNYWFPTLGESLPTPLAAESHCEHQPDEVGTESPHGHPSSGRTSLDARRVLDRITAAALLHGTRPLRVQNRRCDPGLIDWDANLGMQTGSA